MDVHIFNQQKDLCISHAQVDNVVKEMLKHEGIQCDEVSIQFVDTSKICELHQRFFDDPTTTDCISFPIDPPGTEGFCVLGEVFVCPETAINYAKNHNTDPLHEVTLYIIHGLLHLIGYDDISEKDEPLMREAEKRHIKNLENKELILKETPCTS